MESMGIQFKAYPSILIWHNLHSTQFWGIFEVIVLVAASLAGLLC